MHHLIVKDKDKTHDLYFSFQPPEDCAALVKERFGEDAKWEIKDITFEDEWWNTGSD